MSNPPAPRLGGKREAVNRGLDVALCEKDLFAAPVAWTLSMPYKPPECVGYVGFLAYIDDGDTISDIALVSFYK